MRSTDTQFTAEELENSFPLDTGRRFKEPSDASLLTMILEGMQISKERKRKRNDSAERKFSTTVEVVLANLTAAHLNVIDRNQFVAVSYNKNDYNDTELSGQVMIDCRNYLTEQGLIIVAPGFQRWDADGIGKFGRRTRLRATDKLRSLIEDSGLHRRSLTRPNSTIIQIKAPECKETPIPGDVEESRALLTAINSRLAMTDISLDGVMMPILNSGYVSDEGEEVDALHRKPTYAGDLTATALYRVFKYNWRSGGRIYGGWWMSLPRAARPYLTINGASTVELDYKTLHPLLLYRRTNAVMPDDPYTNGAPGSEQMRDLGKRTFNRLLNRRETDPAKRLKIKAYSGDREVLRKVPFNQYLNTFTYRLAGIQQWFGTGEGIRLQYEDSVLALRVLDSMEKLGVPTLPIHDSFIVPAAYEDELRLAMEQALQPYGIIPKIDRKLGRSRDED